MKAKTLCYGSVEMKKSLGLFLGIERLAGGMFQYAESMLEALRSLHEEGWRVEIAYTADVWEPVLADYPFGKTKLKQASFGIWMSYGVMAVGLPGPLARLVSTLINPLPRQLSALNCDAWIFPAQDPLGYQTYLPSVVTIHDLMHRYEPHFPEVAGFGKNFMREVRFSNLAKWGKAILVDSEIGRQHVMECYGAECGAKARALPFVPPRYIFNEAERPDFDATYQLPPKFIFYPAQFWPHKNHKALIEAAQKALVACPDMHLVFSGGKANEYENLVAQAAKAGIADRIRFAGYVPDADIRGFFKRARAMIMPTHFGPTNIPPLEAFVCGCPVAVSAVYAMPGLYGEAAVTFDPKSIAEIAATLEKLWRDDTLCATLREKGQAFARDHDQAKFNHALNKILSEIVKA